MARQIKPFRQRRNEARIRASLRAAQSMLQVRHLEIELKLAAQLDQQAHERYRIGAAGNRDQQAIAASDQIALRDATNQSSERLHLYPRSVRVYVDVSNSSATRSITKMDRVTTGIRKDLSLNL